MKPKIRTRKYFCFPSEFVAARELAGFPIEAAARICGRSTRTILDWEAGKQPVPAWALRLMVLESRYMDALYGLQYDRAIRCAIGRYRTTVPANDRVYSTQLALKLVAK